MYYLLGLPFAVAGGYLFMAVCSFILESTNAASWPAVPAVVEQVELAEQQHIRTGKIHAVLNVRYRYYFWGKRYTSDRVALHQERFIGESFRRSLYDYLLQNQQSGTDITCFVDPDNPQRAVLRRDLRPYLLFLTFLGVLTFILLGTGLGIMGFGLLKERRWKERRRLIGKEWEHRKDWAAGYINHNARTHAATYASILIVTVLLAPPTIGFLLYEQGDEWDTRQIIKGSIGAFILIIASCYYGIRFYLIYRKFRATTLVPSRIPYPRETEIPTTLRLHNQLPRDLTGIQATLECEQRRYALDGTPRVSGEGGPGRPLVTLFSKPITGKIQPSPNGSTVVFNLTIPEQHPPSTTGGSRVGIRWLLKVKAPLPGVDLDLEFDLPVFDERGNGDSESSGK